MPEVSSSKNMLRRNVTE